MQRVLTAICFLSCCLATMLPGQLVQKFAEAKDRETRRALLVAAGKLDKPTADVLQLLAEQVAGTDQDLRLTAAASLQQLGMKAISVRPALLAHLRNKDRGVRMAAAMALRSIHAAWAKTGAGLIMRLRSRDYNERVKALDDIARNKEEAKDHVSEIIKILDERDLRSTGREALKRLGDLVAPHLPEVVALLEKTNDPETKTACLWLLQQHPKSCGSFVAVVRNAVGHRDRQVRIQAVATLAHLGGEHEAAARALLQLMDEVDEELRSTVAQEMRHLGKHLELALPQIEAMLKDPRQANTGAWLVLHLKPEQGEFLVPLLAQQLSNPYPNTAWYMTYVLGRLGSHACAAVPALVETLSKGKGHKLLLGAVDALAQVGVLDAAVEQALLEASRREDAEVRRVSVVQAFVLGLTSSAFVKRLLAMLEDDDDRANVEVAGHALLLLGGDARQKLLAHRTGRSYAQALVNGRITASFFGRSLHHANALVRLMALASVPRYLPVARRCRQAITNLDGDQDPRVTAVYARLRNRLQREGALRNPLEEQATQAKLKELQRRGLDALPNILLAIQSDKPKLQVGAIQLLCRLPAERATAAIDVLLACMDDATGLVQESAGGALYHFREQLTPRLEQEWVKGNRRRRVRAALLLRQFGRRRQLPAHVLVAGFEDPSVFFRRYSHVVAWGGCTSKAALLSSLRRALQDKSREIRLQALYKITSLGEQVADIAPALQEMFADHDPDLELPMMNAIGTIGPAGMSMLTAAVRSGDRGLYDCALDHVHRNGKAARPLLQVMLRGTGDEYLSYAGRAARALGAMQYAEGEAEHALVKKALIALLDRIGHRRRGSGRQDLFAGLVAMGTAARFAVQPLLEWARQQRGDERTETIETLARIGATTDQLEDLILAVMNSADPQAVDARRRMLALLGSMGADASFALQRIVESAKVRRGGEWVSGCRCLAALMPKLRTPDQDVVLELIQHLIRTDHPAVDSRTSIEPMVAAMPPRLVPNLLQVLQPALEKKPSFRTNEAYLLTVLAEHHPRAVWSQRGRFPIAGQVAILAGIARLGDRSTPFLQDLLGLVGGKEPALHNAATSCLVAIGSPAVPALLARLEKDDGKVNLATLSILRRMGPKAGQAAAPVAALLRQKRDRWQRKSILETLANLGKQGLNFLEVLSLPKEETLTLLDQARGVQDEEGRIAIVRILLRLEHLDGRFAALLGSMVQSPERQSRTCAITALMQLYPGAKHEPALTRAFCQVLGTAAESKLLEQVLQLLAPPESAAHALPCVLEMLLHEQAGVRLAALRTLAAWGEAAKPAITAIRELSRDDPSEDVRQRAGQMVSGW